MKQSEQRLINCKTASVYLGMTEAALRKNIYLRRFRNVLVKIGGRIYFDRKKLDQLIEDSALKGDINEK